MTLGDILNLKKEQKIAIIGLGKENLQFLEWLLNVAKIDPTQLILADKKEVELSQILKSKIEGYKTFFGENYLEALMDPAVEYVFKAPGIWSLKPEFEAFRKSKGVDRVNSSLIFFIQKYRTQIAGVTGTKGKSTTSALINHLLNSFSPKSSTYCGNTTGISPYQFWTELDQEIDPMVFYVLELSSFQLQDLQYARLSPKFAMITNYFLDHQDQHQTPQEYWQSKDAIFENQTDSDITFYTQTVLDKSQNRESLQKTKNILISDIESSNLQNYIKSPLLGQHNQSNVDQAVAIVAAIRLKSEGRLGDKADISEELKSNRFKYQTIVNKFKGLPHRLELIRSIETDIEVNNRFLPFKINFYDDGYATEPNAVSAAIKALTEHNGEFLWLQITGVDKGSTLEDLVTTILYKEIENKTFRIDYCGNVGQRVLNSIYEILGTNQNVPNEKFRETILNNFTNINEIKTNFTRFLQELLDNYQSLGNFQKIHEIISKNQIVLNIALSPCGSSFDEFNNYTERCQWWIEQVLKIEE